MPRKHITSACTACRESKIRCDGSYPRCGNCKVKAKECLYQQGEDKRKLSVRKAIEVFSRRVSQLEDFIQASGLDAPPIEAMDDVVMMKRMMKMLSTPAGRDYSSDDRVDEDQLNARPNPLVQEITLHKELVASTIQVADILVPGMAPEPPDAPKPLMQPAAVVTPGSESSPDNSYGTHESENGGLLVPHVDMDGVPAFNMDSIDFPDWTIDFAELNTHPVETTTYDWDQLRQPYPAYPNIDFGMPPPPPPAPLAEINGWPQIWPLTNQSHNVPALGQDSGDEEYDEEEDDVVNQVSDRMGSLHLSEDGELRYYGATSNLTLLDDSPPMDQRFDVEADNVRKRGRTMIEAAGLAHSVSPALMAHLSCLYFAWQDPSFHVVDKDMYEQEQARYNSGSDDSTFYSETLMNTICAFGALYDARRHADLPTPLSDFFMKRAKIWLEVELDSPRVATVQALVIMSSFEAAQTRDARGWLYSGMSMRLSFDLGLHIDMSPYVRSGRMSTEEAEVRKVAFWGSFIVDHLWGVYLGRPPFHINTDEVSVQKPAERTYSSKRGEWVPYGLSKGVSVHPLADPLELVSRHWVLLCEVMGSFCHVLYDRHNVDHTSLQSFVLNTVLQLETWKNNLPRELQVDLDHDGTVYLPHVLVLHMKYFQSLIYIHRPFISKQLSHSFAPSVDHGYLHARKVCIDSAIAISTILRIYRSTCTLRYTNVEVVSIIFSAAIILVFASVAGPSQQPGVSPKATETNTGSNGMGGVGAGSLQGPNGGTIAAHLDTCCKALAELGHVFRNATRTLEVLLAIKRKWQAELLALTGTKRRSSTVVRPTMGCKKRTLSHLGRNGDSTP